MLLASIVLVARFAFYATGPSLQAASWGSLPSGASKYTLMEIKYFNKIVEPHDRMVFISIYYAPR